MNEDCGAQKLAKSFCAVDASLGGAGTLGSKIRETKLRVNAGRFQRGRAL